ncbi:DNA-binding LacI/PurR family transcriptional regulator [Microbacterium sp. SORGH_AS 1204]|uniref:LacI family DNA-binding transcriptional regulator n=1 Tax=Microbacterium sp. SORGH_AS_1204 TaxID=3041785 RepID=UPI00279435A7|nr:LacI family DNA-binding transcriptional regulator [Microbacterium sp. SORGH_AS_1204]MDQ1136244.1 DNA-binding LacI/PurR family transcriptional regulator [Microbacterium sp. SORGH_AS_1204]
MSPKTRKVTQKEIAQLAGVSQTTVSMVLNDRDGTNVRIPDATRERVKRAIEQSTYVADPAARRLAGLDNKIIGIFTYEPALSPESMDFYGPLLTGLERAAEEAQCDLLFFTSSPVEEGRRRLFHRQTRLRLADGCVLLGQSMDGGDLERLVDEGFPFVAVGRRDETAARVPYVGIDYASMTAGLVDQAYARGHRRGLYVHRDTDSPAARDRRAQIASSAATLGIQIPEAVARDDLAPLVARAQAGDATVFFAEDTFLAEDLAHALHRSGLSVPDDVSLAALGEVRGHVVAGRTLSGFHIPRTRVAAAALDLVQSLIHLPADEWSAIEVQQLLSGTVEPGDTLASPASER